MTGSDAPLRPIDDVLGPDVRLLVCGINPGTRSAQSNRHYAGPGNRFWPALSASGLLPHPVGPEDQHLLPGWGIGLTNLVPRPSPRATDVSADELRAGAERLAVLVRQLGNPVVAVLGVTTFRVAFGRPDARRGPQPDIEGFWLLDNPSGLNGRATVPRMAAALAEVGDAAGLPTTRSVTGATDPGVEPPRNL